MRARRVVPGLLAVVALAAASCGDADGSDDTASVSRTESTTAGADDGGMADAGAADDSDDSAAGDDSERAEKDAKEDADEDAENGDADAPAAVPASLDFTATTVDGEQFDGADLAGKPTVLWFWAPWCPVCASQSPSVAELAETHDGELNVIGVAGLDEQAAMEDFIDRNGVDEITHLADVEGTVWKRFEVTEQSTFVVLDADGETRYRQGYREPDELTEHVDELLR